MIRAGVAFGILAFASVCACGLSQQGASDGAGGAGAADSGGIAGGTCFPGSKVCPDATGNLVCLDLQKPDTGCGATACSPCVVPNATAACAKDGHCTIASCNAGFADCNGDPVDGCEVNENGDPHHCGSCEKDCIALGGPSVCKSGICNASDCNPPTLLDCDGNKSNGCEVDGATDPKNCLFCGNVCALTHAQSACVNQQCAVANCDPGWGDCDKNPANGCETDLTEDSGNCGACGVSCNSVNGVAGCANSSCGILCNPGFGNCNGNPSDGCEAELGADPMNCGECAKVCPSKNTVTTCSNSVCGSGGCLPGWGDCDGKTDNGCELDVTSAPTHCGSCTTTCPGTANGTPTCTQSQCSVTCANNYGNCGTNDTCFKIQTDATHCGDTCVKCPPPPSGTGTPVCADFQCNVTCPGGFTACAGDCVDVKTDAANCKTCGHVCSSGQVCQNGTCG